MSENPRGLIDEDSMFVPKESSPVEAATWEPEQPNILPPNRTESFSGKYLQRLQHIQSLRIMNEEHPGVLEPWQVKLLNKAAAATYFSCKELGVEARARIMVGGNKGKS